MIDRPWDWITVVSYRVTSYGKSGIEIKSMIAKWEKFKPIIKGTSMSITWAHTDTMVDVLQVSFCGIEVINYIQIAP